jgi:quinol monooxygenase YgiN
MAGGVVQIQWYATGFRADDLEAALQQLAPLSLRHGARRYEVFRNRDDRYRFLMSIEFDRKEGWEAFWFGEDFIDMRASCSGWYQVPLLYVWHDLVAVGGVGTEDLDAEPAAGASVPVDAASA